MLQVPTATSERLWKNSKDKKKGKLKKADTNILLELLPKKWFTDCQNKQFQLCIIILVVYSLICIHLSRGHTKNLSLINSLHVVPSCAAKVTHCSSTWKSKVALNLKNLTALNICSLI